MSVDRQRPPREAAVVTGVIAALVTLVVGLVPSAATIGVLGTVAAAIGTARGSRSILGLGVLALFGAVLVAGLAALPAVAVLVGVIGTVLVWDVGEQSINVTAQLGREARLRRPIAVHAAASTVVVATAVGVVYATYVAAAGGQPLLALLSFLSGGAMVVLALRL